MSDGLIEALRNYQQADAEGVMVLVSRQACDEAAAELESLRARVAELEQIERNIAPPMVTVHMDHLARLERDSERYEELLYSVQTKHSDESRHETALRYIRNAENQCHGPVQAIDKERG